MELKIMILNVMKYKKEGDIEYNSRLAYIIPTQEACSDSNKFRGYTELSSYRNDDKFFELIPKSFIGQKCTAKVEEVPSLNNPMKSYKQFTEVTCNGETIYLV